MRQRAAQDRAGERVAAGEVGGVARAAGHLLDAVDQRLAHADRIVAGADLRAGRDRLHRARSAAAFTDSMIFT